MLTYKHFDNHSPTTRIWIPGWAFEGRYFYPFLNKDISHIVISKYDPTTISDEIGQLIESFKLKEYELLGLSMGAMCAFQHFTRHPEKISSLNLISISQNYPEEIITPMIEQLKENKKKTLETFYKSCFSTKTDSTNFKNTYFNTFFDAFTTKELINGLHFLQKTHLSFQKNAFKETIQKINVFHGARDSISPVLEIKKWIPQEALTIVKKSGHIDLLNKVDL